MEEKKYKMFITFEGIDGCGKSTIISKIVELLERTGYKVVATREPGGTKISEKIREIIIKSKNMDSITEGLLYASARRQHIVEKIIPSLKEKKIVISDRYIDSSLAYQGIGRKIGMKQILAINSINNKILWPDITFFLDVDPKVALERIKKRDKDNDRFDEESIVFYSEVRKAFLQIAKKYKNRIIVIDANRDKQVIIKEIFEKIKTFL